MALITPTHVYKLADKMTATYRALLGSSSNGAGDATFGASYTALDIKALIEGSADPTFADSDLQVPLNQPAAALSNKLKATTLWGATASSLMSALAAVCARARIVSSTILDLDTFMSWYNYGNGVTYWQCLAPPDWRDMYYAVRSAYPNARNMYFPVRQGTTVLGNVLTNALFKKEIGVGDTAGFVVDYTKWAGGRPFITWTGGNGSGAVSITVTGTDETGASMTYTASGTWGSGSYVASNTAGIALTPSTANRLITSVSSVVISGMSAGTCYIEAFTPSGRTYPPA